VETVARFLAACLARAAMSVTRVARLCSLMLKFLFF